MLGVAVGTAMQDMNNVIYFRRLAVRCFAASRDCFDLHAKEEFRKLAQEFTAKADELEHIRYRGLPTTGRSDG